MKVEMLLANDVVHLQNAINDFIKDKSIIDIKYQAQYCSGFSRYTAMIMYSEEN